MSEESSERRTLGSHALQVFNVIASAGILIMMLHVLANVAMRYLFNSPIAGTHEVVSYWYMPIVAFLGFVLAKNANQNVEAPLIFDRLTWGNRRVLVMLGATIGSVVCALFAYFTFTGEALHGLERRTTGGVSSVPIWPVFFLPSLVFLILTVMFAWDAYRAVRGDIGETPDEPVFPTADAGIDDLADTDVEVGR